MLNSSTSWLSLRCPGLGKCLGFEGEVYNNQNLLPSKLTTLAIQTFVDVCLYILLIITYQEITVQAHAQVPVQLVVPRLYNPI